MTFPCPGACAPGFVGWQRGARGGRPRTGLIVPAARPCRSKGAGRAPRRTRSGPAMGLSLAGPSRVGLWLRTLRWLAFVDHVTDTSGFPYSSSFDGGVGPCTRAVFCGRRHVPMRVGGRHARVWYVCACPRSLWPGRASRPPGRVLVRLTFSCGRFVFLVCLAPSRLGLPHSGSFFFPFVVFCAPPLSLAFFGLPPRALWALAPRFPPPLPACVFSSSFFFFLPSLCAPFVSGFLWFPVPGARGLGAVCCFFCWSPASRLSVRSRLVCVSCPAVGCSLVVATPAPRSPFVSRCFHRCPSVPRGFFLLFFFFFFLFAPPLSPAFSGFQPRVPWALALCVVCFVGLPLLGSPCALASLVFPAWPPAAPWWLLPPPPLVSRGFRRCRFVPCFFFVLFLSSFFVLRPCCLSLSLVSGPGRPGPWRSVLFALLASRFSALPALLPLLCFPPGRLLLPGCCCPPSLSCLAVFVAAARCCVPCAVLCCVSLGAVLRGAAARCAVPCCAVVCRVVLLRSFCCRCLLCRALWCCLLPCALRRCVLRCSPALCALCCVCFVPACWCVLLFAAVCCAVCVLGCSAVRSLSPPLCAVLCFTVLVPLRCAVRVVRAVDGAWCCGALLCVVLIPLV